MDRNLHEVTRHLIGRSYESVGDCWKLVRTVLSLLGLPWPEQADALDFEQGWEDRFTRHARPAPGLVVLFRFPSPEAGHNDEYLWHNGVMLDERWFIQAAEMGVIKSRIDDRSYGAFIQGFYSDGC